MAFIRDPAFIWDPAFNRNFTVGHTINGTLYLVKSNYLWL